ncbi:MAG: RNA-binding protein [Anaerolineae bacterium]|nr:RNA-binding protein [Thermoplasmata archaeon]NIV32237.1 RNA-binding protein [Anaerolineae bacterium]NIY03689.1 RNA-binding protein [Thermoplasmata archaeon]
MSKRLFVGGLAWATTEEKLREAFEDYGVTECKIITHKEGEHEGKSKGFGFVQVEQGDAALAEMDGAELDGRYLRVSEAHQQGGNRRNGNRRGNGNRRREGGRSYR